jgi:hypothetical protein
MMSFNDDPFTPTPSSTPYLSLKYNNNPTQTQATSQEQATNTPGFDSSDEDGNIGNSRQLASLLQVPSPDEEEQDQQAEEEPAALEAVGVFFNSTSTF